MRKTSGARRAIDWAAVKARVKEGERFWEKSLEDDPARLERVMEQRRQRLARRSAGLQARVESRSFLFFL